VDKLHFAEVNRTNVITWKLTMWLSSD